MTGAGRTVKSIDGCMFFGGELEANRSRFSFWRAACTDFGMMMVPFSMCQRRITRAGLTPCAAAIFSIVPLPALRSAPRAIGE